MAADHKAKTNNLAYGVGGKDKIDSGGDGGAGILDYATDPAVIQFLTEVGDFRLS